MNLWRYYDDLYPGLVQVIGGDNFNGTASQLRSFKTQTGATYPLLLTTGLPQGGSWTTLYGPWDNYVIVDPGGIVRYHAAPIWPHGNRYHLAEIRAVVDSILIATGVPEAKPPLAGFTLQAGPNPFNSTTGITLTNPTSEEAPARVTVLDVSGRIVATLLDGPAPPGATQLSWNGVARGRRAASGRYLVRAELLGHAISTSIVLVR